MSSYTVSFRVSEDTVGGRSYETRYEALNKAIRSCVSGKYWDRTSSFYAIQSEKSIDQLAAACIAAIAVSHDTVLMLDTDHKSGRLAGLNADPDIFEVIPYVKKV